MIEFSKEELESLLFALNDWRSPDSDLPIYVNIRNTLQEMLDDATPPPPKSLCRCGDQYHPNGAICLERFQVL